MANSQLISFILAADDQRKAGTTFETNVKGVLWDDQHQTWPPKVERVDHIFCPRDLNPPIEGKLEHDRALGSSDHLAMRGRFVLAPKRDLGASAAISGSSNNNTGVNAV